MIHHLARAFATRQQPLRPLPLDPILAHQPDGSADPGARRPVRARPLTPWQVKPAPGAAGDGANMPEAGPRSADQVAPSDHRCASGSAVRISTDPTDARRTVIAGRFAAVCAALDRLVREQEALA